MKITKAEFEWIAVGVLATAAVFVWIGNLRSTNADPEPYSTPQSNTITIPPLTETLIAPAMAAPTADKVQRLNAETDAALRAQERCQITTSTGRTLNCVPTGR